MISLFFDGCKKCCKERHVFVSHLSKSQETVFTMHICKEWTRQYALDAICPAER